MPEASTELQRLDFVAKSQCNRGLNSGTTRLVMTGLASFIILLAIVSEAPRGETLQVRVLAGVALVCAVTSWLLERYAGFAWTAMFLTIAVETLLTRDFSRRTPGWAARLWLVAYFLYMAFFFFKRSWDLAVTEGSGWEKEREQVHKWAAILGSSNESSQVLQFSAGSFWTGYFVYRMLNAGFCWVVAKFRKSNVRKMIECRVLDLGAVRQTRPREGELGLEIDNRPLPKVKASPDMQARLFSSLNPK